MSKSRENKNLENRDTEGRTRVERVPLHRQKVFVGETRDGFKRLWVNEVPGEIERFQLAGWSVVAGNTASTHEELAQVESQMCSVVRRVVNRDPNAKSKTAVLMEIPLTLFKEDFADEQRLIDEEEKRFDAEQIIKASRSAGGRGYRVLSETDITRD